MRVTQFTLYNNFLYNQQKTLNNLNTVQTQIATGIKIKNIYEEPAVFTKYLQLNQEINSYEQINSSANYALTFANQTDTTLNEFVTTLGSFKTNLLKAANDTNDETSRAAIVKELENEMEHLKNLANTSLDGKYIFSGNKFNTKPISDDYQYQGNDAKVKTFLGYGIEREYNIDGAALFLGRDDDYSKHISLNIPQYDKMKAHPQFVVRGKDGKLYIDKNIKLHNKSPDSPTNPINEPITSNSQIRMLTGVSDIYNSSTDTYNDGTSYFYVKGKKPNGESINEKFSLSNSATVSDLLEKIGTLYGNTVTSKVVEVNLNDMGEIQIKDIKTGKMITDFYMVASDKNENDIEDLVKNGDYIVEFQKSDLASIALFSNVKASNSYFDNSIYKFGINFKKISDHQNAIPKNTVQSVLGNVNLTININGATYKVSSSETFEDLLNKINNANAGYKAYMDNGEIIIKDTTINDPSSNSNLNISMITTDNNAQKVIALTPKDSVNFDKLYMQKKDNTIKSDISQIINDYKITFKDGSVITEFNENAQSYATEEDVIADTIGNDKMPQTIKLNFRDLNGNPKTAVITLRDTPDINGHLSTFEIDGKVYDIFEPNGNLTPAHDTITTKTKLNTDTCEVCKQEILDKGMTYKQLGDVVSMLVTGNLPATNSSTDYNNAVNKAKQFVATGMDEKGRFFLTDKTENPTKTDLSIYTDNNSLYFEANNALTIDAPQIDFFEILQKAIESVKNGNYYPDSEKDPRNFGIQGAIEAIDHLTDHIRRSHAKIGSIGKELQLTIERTQTLKLNAQQLQSDNIDTDIGEATMKLNSLNISYQALLASIAKINNVTLLNYL